MKQHKHPVHPIYKNKTTLAVYLTLRALIIFILIRAVFRAEYESVFLCALSLVLMLMPSILSKKLKIVLPDTLEIIILLFIFAAEILGELNSFYVRVPNWDTMLHTINGFLCAAIGFSLVDLFNRNKRFQLDDDKLMKGHQEHSILHTADIKRDIITDHRVNHKKSHDDSEDKIFQFIFRHIKTPFDDCRVVRYH